MLYTVLFVFLSVTDLKSARTMSSSTKHPTPSTIKRTLIGASFVFVLFFTSTFGIVLWLPLFLLLFATHHTLARWITDLVTSTWLILAPAVYEVIYGVKIRVTGDVSKLSEKSCSLIVMNHRTRLDWLFILSLQARYASLRRFKISLKYPLRNIPGGGWAMQSASFLFLKRTWEEDKPRIESILNHFRKWDCPPQLLLFPEGTDFQEESREKSRQYAKKNDLPEFECVLHPRTTGFVSICEYMRRNNGLEQIVDVTIGYPQNLIQNETEVFSKELPREIVFHVRVFDINTIPENGAELGAWVEERWTEKDQLLKTFYETKSVSELETDQNARQTLEIERVTNLYYAGALVYWFLLTVISVYWFIMFPWVRWYYLLSTVTCVGLSYFIGIENAWMSFDDFDNFQHLNGIQS